MRKGILWLACALFVLLGVEAVAEEAKPQESTQYGAKFELKEQVGIDALLAKPEAYADKTIRVRGKITSVCKKKGCWLILGQADVKDKFVRIRMKDYGFFVPLDCGGQTATVEGVFTRKLLEEKMVKHYAEDAGKDPNKVSGKREELSMLATGISIER